MKCLTAFLKSYIYSSIHIALIAWISYYLLNYNSNTTNSKTIHYSNIVGFATFLYYNFSQILAIRNYNQLEGNEELTWISKNFTEILFAMGFVIVLFIFEIFQLKYFEWKYGLGIIALLCFAYFPLKNIPILRNLIIGFAWFFILFYFLFPDLELILIIGFYYSFISYIYDQTDSIYGKFIVDLFVILPSFCLYYLSSQFTGLD